MTRAATWLALGLLVAACRPELGSPPWLVTGARILAVQAEPPEVAPGELASFRALVATPAGTFPDAAVAWAFCTAPKPPGENNTVDPACLTESLAAAGPPGPTLSATVPTDACVRFGPQAPPPLRPRDPDPTGGYFQPLRARLGEESAIFLERIACELAQASAEVAAEFRARYRRNRNPRLLPLAASRDGAPAALDRLPAGAEVTLIAAWSEDSAETYPVFDPATQTLVDHREAMSLSWYASAGRFAAARTGRDEDAPATTSDNRFIAPAEVGRISLWLVLRDARGGIAMAAYEIEVGTP